MKTEKALSHKLKIGMAITILISALLVLASCQNEELLTNYLNEFNDQNQNILQVAHFPTSFEFIQIDNHSMTCFIL